MPRKKTIQPDPLASYEFEDGAIVEFRDETCLETGKGLYKRHEYEAIRDAVLEQIFSTYVDKKGKKTLGHRDNDILKSGYTFDKWYVLNGFPDRDESQIRKKLYKDIKTNIKIYIDTIESNKI
ncbi:hypothetical protein N9356_01125 [Porticoccaceae bacterium]|jgi:hypothetical protein|nr:hypothetical protein [Cellvibrionales bacterium]MDB3925732.1 hypothetical protein [Porticoccaceae bacterium]